MPIRLDTSNNNIFKICAKIISVFGGYICGWVWTFGGMLREVQYGQNFSRLKDALLADEALEVGADEGVMLCEEERSEEKYEKFCRANEGIRNMMVSLLMELSFCDDGVCKFQPQWIKSHGPCSLMHR